MAVFVELCGPLPSMPPSIRRRKRRKCGAILQKFESPVGFTSVVLTTQCYIDIGQRMSLDGNEMRKKGLADLIALATTIIGP
jgi:hypothetical protein